MHIVQSNLNCDMILNVKRQVGKLRVNFCREKLVFHHQEMQIEKIVFNCDVMMTPPSPQWSSVMPSFLLLCLLVSEELERTYVHTDRTLLYQCTSRHRLQGFC